MTDQKPPCLIVLGAHVQGETPSKALNERLKVACAYLKAHPEAKAVLSGGKGPGEDITEASAMYRYLCEHGILGERLILEERSTNTKENIHYSLKLIGSRTMPVLIVTNHFHTFRGCAIARKAGCTEVGRLSAPYCSVRLLWYIPREILAYIKDKILGNL